MGKALDSRAEDRGRPGWTGVPVPREFYVGSPEIVAPGLLGKVLVRELGGRTLAGRIVEVEAYMGSDDPAAHSFGGRTARNAVLFGPPGHAYVYFIYGMHYCLNVSCEPDGTAGGVLFRALEPLDGLEEMARLRGLGAVPSAGNLRLLTSGPGRLCQAFGVVRAEQDGIDLTDPLSPLRIVDDGWVPEGVAVTERIGISKAMERPLRFSVAGNAFVTRPHGRVKIG